MRKITEESRNAFNRNENFKKANTEVSCDDFTTELYLHNNLIATKNPRTGVLKITNAGWKKNTTKERLNGLPGVSIYQKNFVWYLNGKEWNGELTKV
jgi:hypothetical protein